MNKIPEEHYVKPFQQQTYLINGELRTWNGDFTNIYSTISSTEQYAPTLLGSVPNLGKEQALEALQSACDAYNKGLSNWWKKNAMK